MERTHPPTCKEKIIAKNNEGKYLYIGLDPDPQLIRVLDQQQPFIKEELHQYGGNSHHDDILVSTYHQLIIANTADLVAGYKLGTAFFRTIEYDGLDTLADTMCQIQRADDSLIITLDGKVGDTKSTNKKHVDELFRVYDADAITVTPYFDKEEMMPFLEQKDKGIFVLTSTSQGNKRLQEREIYLTIGELWDLLNGPARKTGTLEGWNPYMTVSEYVAHEVCSHWNENDNCGLVVGNLKQFAQIRKIAGPEIPFLSPGLGAQGLSIAKVVEAGLRKDQLGLLSSSRASTYPERNPGELMGDAIRRVNVDFAQQLKTAQNSY